VGVSGSDGRQFWQCAAVHEQWKDGSITFSRAAMLDQKISQERFRYDRQSEHSFKMTYERSVDGQWKLGDFIVCMRN
jgi:hypothetical protein